jgi:MFS family permease
MRSLASMFRYNMADRADYNAWYITIEIFWATFLVGAGTFGAAYAVHLGATDFQIGLLSSIPSLLAVVISVGAGIFFQHTRRAKFWILGSLSVYRLGHILLVLLPFLGMLGVKVNLGFLVVCTYIFLSIPNTFASLGFTDMLAAVIPVDRRAGVFANRNIIYFVTLSATTFILGYWLAVKLPFDVPSLPAGASNLHQWKGYSNYQLMFLAGLVLSVISLILISKVKRPETPLTVRAEAPVLSLSEQWQFTRKAFRNNPAFIRLMVNYILYAVGMWIAGPLYILYFVRMLGASDTWLGWNGTISYVVTVVGYTIWRRILPRWGEQKALRRSIICLGLYPMLISIFPSLNLFLVLGGLSGLIGPGTDLSQLNLLMKVLPEDSRPQFLGIYNALINLVAFICPMIGVSLGAWIGIRPTLFICGALAIVGSLSYWLMPIVFKEEEKR